MVWQILLIVDLMWWKKGNKLENNLEQFRDENAREHLEIKLRLDNVPYRFELKDLTDRVEKLEKKAKFT